VHEEIKRVDRLIVNAMVGREYELARKMFLFGSFLNYFRHSLSLLLVKTRPPSLGGNGKPFVGVVFFL
jgi:hypothetical protein